MKKLIFLFFIISSPTVYSVELKLSCNIRLDIAYSTGTLETKQYNNEVFEIYENANFRSIIATSDNFYSFSNKKSPNTISIDDFSNVNKWDITIKSIGYKDGVVNSKSIRIDRNVGKIWTSADFYADNGVTFSSNGVGDCEKINITKKKF